MLITDPDSDARIDTTGWDLDHLREHLGNLALDIAVGSDRPLSDDEDALLDMHHATGLPGVQWTTRHRAVVETVSHLLPIVQEAIFQRELPRAIEALSAGRPLTMPQEEAYRDYLREMDLPDRR